MEHPNLASIYFRWGSFSSCCLCLAGVWLVLLPRLSEHPVVRERVELLERSGIHPAAMFYTELEVMKPILHRLEGAVVSKSSLAQDPAER